MHHARSFTLLDGIETSKSDDTIIYPLLSPKKFSNKKNGDIVLFSPFAMLLKKVKLSKISEPYL